jgi:hypothetical protein
LEPNKTKQKAFTSFNLFPLRFSVSKNIQHLCRVYFVL